MTDSLKQKPNTHGGPAASSRKSGTPVLEHTWREVPLDNRIQLGLIAVLFVLLHWEFLEQMGKIARLDPDWSHAYLVPLISLYFVHHLRDKILETPAQTFWPGLLVFWGGIAAFMLSIFPVRSPMFQGYAMIIELLGLCLFLLGPKMVRHLAFPIVYLGFGVKISGELWGEITRLLQKTAANSSTVLLNMLGIDAELSDTTIELWRGAESLGALNVAEACSGLRMLVAFLALGVAITYLVDRSRWARAVMLVLAVPIAVAVNVARVTITGMLHLVNPELSTGDFHVFVGMLMVFPALGIFLLVAWLLDNIVEVDPHPSTATGRTES